MKNIYTDIDINIMPDEEYCSPLFATSYSHLFPVGYPQQKLISSNFGRGFPLCHQCWLYVETGWFIKSISCWVHFPCIDDLIKEINEVII